MKIWKDGDKSGITPPNHFGGLEVLDIVPLAGSAFSVQVSKAPPGGGAPAFPGFAGFTGTSAGGAFSSCGSAARSTRRPGSPCIPPPAAWSPAALRAGAKIF